LVAAHPKVAKRHHRRHRPRARRWLNTRRDGIP
jgi:hypothetical protein